MIKDKKNGKIVCCVSCKKPIHIDHWGGLFTIKGIKGHFMIHKDKDCLRKWMLEIKPELELRGSDNINKASLEAEE